MNDYIGAAAVVTAIFLWWKLLKHRHDWTEWTDWVMHSPRYDRTAFIRERYCLTCRKTDRQEIGEHECAYKQDCPHRDVFVAAFDKDVAIQNIEKELGL
jgi:hypothetical protein